MPSRRPERSRFAHLRERAVLFAALGLGFGLLLCAYATLLRIFTGTEAFDANGTTYAGTVATYLIGPTVGGVVVALLFPLTRWRLGAVFVGFVAAIPIYACVAVATGVRDFVGVLICALGGGAVGYLWSGEE